MLLHGVSIMDRRETKDFKAEVKADVDKGIIEGHANTFGDIDLVNDQVIAGAFTETITERFPKNLIKMLWQHDAMEPIGRPTHLEEDSTGLAFVAKVSPTTKGKDALILMDDGVVDRMSIGYGVQQADYFDHESRGKVRQLKKLKLFEFSPVTFPANENAVIRAVKGMQGSLVEMVASHPAWNDYKAEIRDISGFQPGTLTMVDLEPGVKALVGVPYGMTEQRVQMLRFSKSSWSHGSAQEWLGYHLADLRYCQTKEALPFRDLPLASRERPWDASEAEQRVRVWADAEGSPTVKYRRAFAWYDSDAPDNFTSYKLQLADVVDGELMAIPKAIFAIAGVLGGARGGVSIPESDASDVKRHVEKYYSKMASEWDDDTIVPPWNKSAPAETVSLLGQELRHLLTIARGERA